MLDMEPYAHAAKPWTDQGATFVQQKMTPENYANILRQYIGEGDLIIDLSWNIETVELLAVARQLKAFYINTSVEVWDPYNPQLTAAQKTLWARREVIKERGFVPADGQVTAVLNHGMNPGLISHLVKQGLLDLAANLLAKGLVPHDRVEPLMDAMQRREFGKIAYLIDIKVVHGSERDTQIDLSPFDPMVDKGTWSLPGLHEESETYAEAALGRHEAGLPKRAEFVDPNTNDGQLIYFHRRGMNTYVRSFVPRGDRAEDQNAVEEIYGLMIRHDEVIGIAKMLMHEGKTVTTHYAYQTCPKTHLAMEQWRNNRYQMAPKYCVMNDEIVAGHDAVGALLGGHALNAHWTGWILDIDSANRSLPGQNATTTQVAYGVVGAIKWMLENPRRGVVMPEDLPHEEILQFAKQGGGQFISQDYNWTPIQSRLRQASPELREQLQRVDPWRFEQTLMQQDSDH